MINPSSISEVDVLGIRFPFTNGDQDYESDED